LIGLYKLFGIINYKQFILIYQIRGQTESSLGDAFVWIEKKFSLEEDFWNFFSRLLLKVWIASRGVDYSYWYEYTRLGLSPKYTMCYKNYKNSICNYWKYINYNHYNHLF